MFYDCLCEDGAMRMGESSQGTLTCVGQSLLLCLQNFIHVFILFKDVDECSVNSDVCGFGTCTNNPNGEFYMCECEDGATLGTNSDNLPTCFGMQHLLQGHTYTTINFALYSEKSHT